MNGFFKKDKLLEVYKNRFSITKSKGIDKLSTTRFEEKIESELELIERKVAYHSYEFSYYLEKLVLKGRGKAPRVLSIPTLRDRIVLNQLKLYLAEKIPQGVNKIPAHIVAKSIVKKIGNNSSYDYYLKIDITNFYGSINREILIKKLKDLKLDRYCIELIKIAINNPTVPLNFRKVQISKYFLDIGIPQGLSISNTLAHIYMLEFDEFMSNKDCFYVRYVDDILIFCKENKQGNIKQIVKDKFKELGLSINESKTYGDALGNEMEFLSYKFVGNLVTVAEKNIQKRIGLIAAKFTWFKNGWKNKKKRPYWLMNDNEMFQQRFIKELNSLITGRKFNNQLRSFLEYYKEINDVALLFKLDNIVKSFFKGVECFDGKPDTVKTFVRAYYEIKYNKKTTYIPDIDEITSVKDKRNFLVEGGYIDRRKRHSDEYIEKRFAEVNRKTEIENTGFHYGSYY